MLSEATWSTIGVVVVAIAALIGATILPSQAALFIGFGGTICTLIVTSNRAAAKTEQVAAKVEEAAVKVEAVKVALGDERTKTAEKLDEIHSVATATKDFVNGAHGEILKALAVALEHTAAREQTPAATEAAAAARRISTEHEAATLFAQGIKK